MLIANSIQFLISLFQSCLLYFLFQLNSFVAPYKRFFVYRIEVMMMLVLSDYTIFFLNSVIEVLLSYWRKFMNKHRLLHYFLDSLIECSISTRKNVI